MLQTLNKYVLFIAYAFFCYLMVNITLQYIPYDTDVAFLRIKQDIVEMPFYKLAFFTHVYTAIFVLIAGFTQFSNNLRKNYPSIHRKFGWLYAAIVLLFASPSGFYMGIFANGGIYSQVSFCILAVLWFYFTLMAVIKIKQGNIAMHRAFFIRSFALAASAITLRLWKYLIILSFDTRPMDAYRIVAWLGWVPNLLFAEYVIHKFNLNRMKKLLFLVPLIVFFSCGKTDKPSTQNKGESKDSVSTTKQVETLPDTNKKIYGYYVGEFKAVKYDRSKDISYTNKITVSLDSIRGENFFGHSVVAGNSRPFKGSYQLSNKNYIVEAAEPGDDKYDGKFIFTVYTASQSIKGKWNAYKSSAYVTEREYDLQKRDFKYNPELKLPENVSWQNLYEQNPSLADLDNEKGEFLTNDVLKVNSSKKLLNKNEIENMHKGDLEIIRNSIYARHGYSFKNRKIRYIFDNNVDWYMPLSTDVSKELTEIELKNIELLKRYEEHAEKYYDSFGR